MGLATGCQKPFMVDLHFVDSEVLRQQPRWAEPNLFTQEETRHDRYLWVYAFALADDRICLWGDDPASFIHVYEPLSYVPWVANDLSDALRALSDSSLSVANPTPEIVGQWKNLAGEVLRLLALIEGTRSLRKEDVYRYFQELVPPFDSKDFAEGLWAEYLHGPRFAPLDRCAWLGECEQFCRSGMAMVAKASWGD
jgi:hypothetical protein